MVNIKSAHLAIPFDALVTGMALPSPFAQGVKENILFLPRHIKAQPTNLPTNLRQIISFVISLLIFLNLFVNFDYVNSKQGGLSGLHQER